ncbi:MAG: hypothetical protein IKF55_06380, partial [Oscillospiraceae bacterium]|nr:hypothetical protein [Oscillospiraceae bacterium]
RVVGAEVHLNQLLSTELCRIGVNFNPAGIVCINPRNCRRLDLKERRIGSNMSMRSSLGFQSSKSVLPQAFFALRTMTSYSRRSRTIGLVSTLLLPIRRK